MYCPAPVRLLAGWVRWRKAVACDAPLPVATLRKDEQLLVSFSCGPAGRMMIRGAG
jgi:hypothetical protein